MDLRTRYLGMRLSHPLIVGAGPLGDDLDRVRALEDAGATMLVLRSLYEEEITGEQMEAFLNSERHSESFAEAETYAPDPLIPLGPDEYLEHLRAVKSAVDIPVMASLNGITPGGWTSYARLLEQAGADGLELHIYHAASDMALSAADVEQQAHPGRHQAGAAPDGVRAFRQTAREGRRRRAGALHALPPRGHRRR